jgi:hypothetical protein
MGAAIPHMLQLVFALPPILPFSADEIKTLATTGTVEVQDEMLPANEDEEITYRTRGKSTLLVVFQIGDGVDEGTEVSNPTNGEGKRKKKRHRGRKEVKVGEAAQTSVAEQIVVQEPEQNEVPTI